MDLLNSHDYYLRFAAAARGHNGDLTQLEHGGSLATFGEGPRLALMSGLHGDERSGPLAILQWLEESSGKELVPRGCQLWVAPLVNAHGWDAGVREWNGQDLNRLFGSDAPPFLSAIMNSLDSQLPCVFLDLHEDSDRPELYIYHYVEDRHDVDVQLAEALGATLVAWSDFGPWEGSGEVFLRRRGCQRCITIEIPPTWSLDERIGYARRAIEWMTTHLDAIC